MPIFKELDTACKNQGDSVTKFIKFSNTFLQKRKGFMRKIYFRETPMDSTPLVVACRSLISVFLSYKVTGEMDQ